MKTGKIFLFVGFFTWFVLAAGAVEIETFGEPSDGEQQFVQDANTTSVRKKPISVGLITTFYTDRSKQPCTAVPLLILEERFFPKGVAFEHPRGSSVHFALTAASCLKAKGKQIKKIILRLDSEIPKPEFIVHSFVTEWNGESAHSNYALLYFSTPLIELEKEIVPSLSCKPIGLLRPIVKKPETTAWGPEWVPFYFLKGYNKLEKTILRFSEFDVFGGADHKLSQDSYFIEIEEPYDMRSGFRGTVISDFWKETDPVGRGSPLLLRQDGTAQSCPLGFMIENGKILAITSKMEKQFLAYARNKSKPPLP